MRVIVGRDDANRNLRDYRDAYDRASFCGLGL